MAQGNPNKVNAIVDEIVENNNVFKLKSPIEQDREKDSIAKSINSSISILNEVGKELVLQELSVDPDEKFKGFIDSVGNVDISGLTQMTTTIVKVKIEEAEREGIDLRQGQPVFKDNYKKIVAEGILTVAVIDKMVNNFRNLSDTDRKEILNNWHNLSKSQQAKVAQNYAEMLQGDSMKAANENDRKTLELASKTNEDIQNWIESGEEISDDEAENIWKDVTIDDIKSEPKYEGFCEFLNNQSIKLESIYNNKKLLANKFLEYTIREQIQNSEEMHKSMARSGNITPEQGKKLQTTRHKLYHYGMKKVRGPNSLTRESRRQSKSKITNIVSDLPDVENRIIKQVASSNVSNILGSDKINLHMKFSQKIEQLPSALVKAGFSQEEIHENFTKYISTLKSFEIDDIENFKKWDTGIRKEQLESFLIEDGMDEKMAEILSKINFNGKLFNILGNEEQKKEFFEQFDKVINQEHIQERDTQLDGELEEIFSGYFQDNALDMDVSAIETQKEQVTDEQVKQEEPKEMYSFIDSEYLKQDSIEGLIPRNGDNSQSSQDDKKAIFYSQGKEGAIVMYFEFLKQYERLKGSAGDKALEQYASYKNGTIELSDEQVQLLQGQLKQITQMRETKDFDEFMGDKLYLKLNGIDTEQDRQAAEEWRASHPGTRMDYNYANSWTNSAISPDRIDVVSLQSKDGTDVRTSQKDLIKYFLSQTSIDKIEELGVNDTTLENIRKYYQEHSAEITQMGEEYSVVTQNIQEFEQSRKNSNFEKQTIEQEKDEETSQNMAMVEQDNSFIGKIKRVFANMRDMKNKDNSKGFFARLGASIQTVFGKKDEYSENQDKAKEQINNDNSSKTEQPISFDEQLRQGIDQNKFNQPNIPKDTIKEEKDSLNRDDDYEQK